MTEKRGADIIAEKLVEAGATHAFGMPGGEVLGLLDGFLQNGIDFKLTRHENAAGFMAEGHWHATGRLPVLVATIGPGAANAINVVANAMQDRVPMIFFTGCVDEIEEHSYTHQVFDHRALLAPIVKGSFRVAKGAVGRIMDKAIRLALDGQPGPVHIDLPISVSEKTSPEAYWPLQPMIAPVTPATGPALQSAREALLKAKHPLAVAGVDAVNEGAGQEITDFCTRFNIPLVTSYKGKGLLDESHPLALGGAGLSPKADKHLMPLIAEADCLVLLGYDPIEMRTGWRDPWAQDVPVIDITPAARYHTMHYASHTLLGTVRDTLPLLTEGLEPGKERWNSNRPAEVRSALKEAFSVSKDSSAFGPEQVFDTLHKCLPENTIVTADSGAHRILVSQMWESTSPRSFLQSSALCTMSCAVPLASGYKMALEETGRDVPVLAFVGDAGLEMGLGELATLREYKLPVVVCVLVDESLALIELKQRNSNRQNSGVDFTGSNFPAIAEALGGHGVWIDDEETLKAEADAALKRDCFTLLACRIGRKAYDGKF
ncbi:thiamine pyrophosphate-binding protein [Kiloniella sp. b19]|uniref:thiamine pyrophosphate-binding protein n=1 Tax=Kiloniella sp. GXU_MW_B19 TaxID=3141326 RepID=UPI0031D98180